MNKAEKLRRIYLMSRAIQILSMLGASLYGHEIREFSWGITALSYMPRSWIMENLAKLEGIRKDAEDVIKKHKPAVDGPNVISTNADWSEKE